VTVHGLFSTTGGADDFFFLGAKGLFSFNGFSVSDVQLTLIYFPTAYGTVVATAAPSGAETISYESVVTPPKGAETGLVLRETGGKAVQFQVAEGPRQGADQAGFQQELARVKAEMRAEMEARMQKLEELLRQNQPGADLKP
jgi:hypothetical protein